MSNIDAMQRRLEQILAAKSDPPKGYLRTGRLRTVGPTLMKAHLPDVFMGEVCRILPGNALAEVVGVEGSSALLSPFGDTSGHYCGQRVIPTGRRHRVPVGTGLLGRVVDGLGRALDGGPPLQGPLRDYDAPPPSPLSRQLIERPMLTGIRAIDSLTTCGEGQRMGIFAAPGVGKSVLLAMLCQSADSEITVLALVGERGREVREFLEKNLSAEVRQRTVVVVSTSDRPAMERMRALFVATTIAEAFRDRGHRVMLLADSLTRYARAAREIALASGETIGAIGYPASVFASLPRLLERAGKAERGCITAFYTVLVENDDMNEPLADEVRSLLDGHIVLSRRLAEGGHFPAIDVLASLSRLMPLVVDTRHRVLAGEVRNLLSVYRDVELLVRIGEFKPGEDPVADLAVKNYPAICDFLKQRECEPCELEALLRRMQQLTGN